MLLISAIAFPTLSWGQNKKQLEREKATIEREIARLSSELGKAKKNSKNSTKQINLIKQRINERNKLINNINNQMNALDQQINRTADSLDMVRDQIISMKAEYAKILRVMYNLRQNINPVSLIFDNEAYNLTYLKLKYFTDYSRYCKCQAEAIERKQHLFEDMSFKLQQQKREKNNLLSQEKKQRDALAREQQQQQKKLNKSQQDERNLQQQISKKEKQKRQLQQQIQQLINAEVAKASTNSTNSKPSTSTGSSSTPSTASNAASAEFVGNKGKLPWPVNYKSVAREFGLYTHSSGGQNRNNGIDLNCSPGAAVYAVFNGTVARIFSTPNGAKGIIIRHGNYMTVYAGLGSVNVSQGSKVTTHQVIGTVAPSDEATSEFSFQVWCGTDALNPRKWLR